MNEFTFFMNFKESLNLNMVASRLLPAMEGSEYKHVVSTPAVILFQHEKGYQMTLTPANFTVSMLGDFEYDCVEEQLSTIIKAYSVVVTSTGTRQFFGIKYANILSQEEDIRQRSKELLKESILDSQKNLAAAGIRLLYASMVGEGAYDEMKFEPFLQDTKKWYAAGVFHCSMMDNSEVPGIIAEKYADYGERLVEIEKSIL